MILNKEFIKPGFRRSCVAAHFCIYAYIFAVAVHFYTALLKERLLPASGMEPDCDVVLIRAIHLFAIA